MSDGMKRHLDAKTAAIQREIDNLPDVCEVLDCQGAKAGHILIHATADVHTGYYWGPVGLCETHMSLCCSLQLAPIKLKGDRVMLERIFGLSGCAGPAKLAEFRFIGKVFNP